MSTPSLHRPDASRWSGLAFVALLHLAALWALGSAFQRVHQALPAGEVVVDPGPAPEPREPPEPLKGLVRLDAAPSYRVIRIPSPDWQTEDLAAEPPGLRSEPGRAGGGTGLDGALAGGPAPDVVAPALPERVEAGLLCPVMPRPELAVELERAVELRVLGTVRAGRVVALQFEAASAGTPRRLLRQLQQGVEQTLREGYRCSSDGVFVQEFLFRP